MNILDIIAIEGIVIRKIPVHSTSLYSYREGDEKRLKPNQEIIMINETRKMIREVKENKFGGKYFITTVPHQGATVIFNQSYDGIGDTIEKAYKNYLKKKGVA